VEGRRAVDMSRFASTLLRRPLLGAALAFVLALPLFVAVREQSIRRYTVSKADAIGIARDDRDVAQVLAHAGRTTARVTPLDDVRQRVSFFRGPRLVLDAAVSSRRRVTNIALHASGAPESGSRIANSPPVLAGMTLLFLLAVLTLPLRSVRNLDALAFASFSAPVWLFNLGLIEGGILAAYPALAYLIVRCLRVGLGGGAGEAGCSLLWRLVSRLAAPSRRRIVGAVVAGLALMVTVVTVTSTGASDVAFAALAGATDLIHGVVPYGHIPGFILHGDTYPLLTYVAYVPAAAIMPVRDVFDDPQGALIVAAVVVLAVAWLLYRLAVRTATAARTGADDPDREPARFTGLRMSLAWLAFPPVLLSASSGSNDVLLALCVVLALTALAHRARAAVIVGVAAWVKLIPLLALPVLLARGTRRSAARAVAGLAALSAILTGSIVALGGLPAIGAMMHALDFQFERSSLASLWLGVGLGWLQPAAEASLVAVVVAGTFAVSRDRGLRDDLPRLAALLTGIVLLAQFAANYWTWAYLPWAAAPALLVLVRGQVRVAVGVSRQRS